VFEWDQPFLVGCFFFMLALLNHDDFGLMFLKLHGKNSNPQQQGKGNICMQGTWPISPELILVSVA